MSKGPPAPAATGPRILVATDAWHPQVNGVVRTYERVKEQAAALGVEIVLLTPEGRRTFPLPTYPEIRLARIWPREAGRVVETARPDYVHIATEGTIGLAVRAHCRRRGRPFTTSYHTRFPDYLAARFPVPRTLGYRLQRWFHDRGCGMFVASRSLEGELEKRGFRNILSWSRGVDTELFRPRPVRHFGEGPVFLYAGRIAVEKNLEAFLALDLPGRKVVVGSGPLRQELERRYPMVLFTGPRFGEELAEAIASADVFVFPSRTDTFGIVMLEAMASGVPVAAFSVTGPLDVVESGRTGVLDADLRQAALAALELDSAGIRSHALAWSWQATAETFVRGVVAANARAGNRPAAAGRWLV
jgi:glycosyltransferase involved in cell wall biosynthesis